MAGDVLRWHQEKMMWMVIAIPGASVVFGVLMITMAISHPDDVVSGNYYKDGMAINVELSALREAQSLGVAGTLAVDGNCFLFAVNTNGAELLLRLTHASDASQDATRTLSMVGGMARICEGAIWQRLIADGRWQLTISDPGAGWERQARITTPIEEPAGW